MSRKFKLASDYKPAGDQPKAIKSLVHGIQRGLAYQTLLGVTGSGKTFSIANVIATLQRPAILLAPNKTLAAQLYGEMKTFFPDNAVEYFVSYYDYYQPEAYVPASDIYIEKDASISEHIEQLRLSATKSILEREDTIVVASVSAIYGLGDPISYMKMALRLVRGNKVGQRTLLRQLTELQYTRNDKELRRATYRVRGDVVDVFPAESDGEAIRIELFDDEIASLRSFDPLTGKVICQQSEAIIYPKTHYVTQRQIILDAIDTVRQELHARLAELTEANKLVEAQRLEQRTNYDMEMMLEIGYCSGVENYSRHLSGSAPGEPPPTLMDYLPDQAIMFVDESHVTLPQLEGMYKGDHARKGNLVEYGFRLPSALDNRPLKFDEFKSLAPQMVFVSATPGKYEYEYSGNVIEQVARPTGLLDPELEVRPVNTQIDDLISEINDRAEKSERVLVTTLTKRMAENLTEYMFEQGVRVRYLHSDVGTVERVEIIRDLRIGEFDVLIGINLLREGLDLPEVSLVAILDADKEGFLRSGTTLIQTIGRAARNINGKAILYADRITHSMQYAIDETNRRRNKQWEFNKAHGITPQGICKKVMNIIGTDSPKQYKDSVSDYTDWPQADIAQEINKLEEQMYQCARDLDFELAAKLRDKIQRIQVETLGQNI